MEVQIDDKFSRFKGATWFDIPKNVIVGGGGGIGSWLCLFLASMDASIYLYEFDIVDRTNLGGQFFGKHQIGKSKAESILATMTNYADNTKFNDLGKFEEGSMVDKHCFSCFDNMKARKLMFNAWKQNAIDNNLTDAIFIDGRLEAETFQVFAVPFHGEKMAEYERDYLFDDSEVVEGSCTLKQTRHVAAIIAGFMCGIYTNFLSNVKNKMEVQQVPFKQRFDLRMMQIFEGEHFQ